MYVFKLISLMLQIVFLLVASEALHAQTGNGKSHSFFNYEWKVDHSRGRWSTRDCNEDHCLNVGDSISVEADRNVKSGDAALFKINGADGRPDFRFTVAVQKVKVEKCQNSKQCMKYFRAHFFDTAHDPDDPPKRTICVSAVRYEDAYRYGSSNACETKLRSLAKEILKEDASSNEVKGACKNENLIYWDITNGHHESCAKERAKDVELDPEPGQGTASGTQ